ncbi:ATP-binding protein [Mucilaginibacter litoreus]|uniref:histidine kinase n=1 Tax=Mucilaginibacter litoreus TaxID=1048221 RepID=A0ABW3AS01_9SPHI
MFLHSDLTDFDADIKAISQIQAIPSILEMICRTTGMGFAAVARVTEDRWITCAVLDKINFGLVPGSELEIRTTICNEIRQHQQPVIIEYVSADEVYANHHTPAKYGFESYISVPVKLKNGTFFGTLCAIDPEPAPVNTSEVRQMFSLFAELIATQLDAADRLKLTQDKLNEELRIAELREQFIAILGHDLRNPIGAISTVAQALLRMPLDEKTKRLANILKDSSYRMKILVSNLMDFASGRLGGGLTLNIKTDEPIANIIAHVIEELRLVWPNHLIEYHNQFDTALKADGQRIAQLLSNLLSNALTHGSKSTPVIVKTAERNGSFELCVINAGLKIPEAVRERLFQPFSRGEIEPKQQGLGLGLYIAAEIAKAHAGTISVQSNDEATCFTFAMQLHN